MPITWRTFMLRNKIHGIIFITIVSAVLSLKTGLIDAADYRIHHNPQEYVIDKFQSNDLVFLGTRHKREPILQFISDLIPALHAAGVTHIGLEICSDEHPDECDFTRRFTHMDGSVAMDCDDKFRGWKIGTVSALAIKPAEPYEMVDGVIVY